MAMLEYVPTIMGGSNLPFAVLRRETLIQVKSMIQPFYETCRNKVIEMRRNYSLIPVLHMIMNPKSTILSPLPKASKTESLSHSLNFLVPLFKTSPMRLNETVKIYIQCDCTDS